MNNRMIYQVDETREGILSSAERLFSNKGFFETQIKDVARESGVSRNTVYRYFQDKNDLAMATIEKTLMEYRESHKQVLTSLLNDESLNGLEKFTLAIRKTWMNENNKSNTKLMAEFDAYYSGNRISANMKERFIRLDTKEFVSQIVNVIEEGKSDGSIRPDIDPHLTFVTFLNAVRALSQRILLRGDVLVETIDGETDRMLDHLMDLMTEGLMNRSGK